VSKTVPVGGYLVTAYTNVQVADQGGGATTIRCTVGTDETGHNITRYVHDNNESTTPWTYSVFIGTTPGHSTISLDCNNTLTDSGTYYDPQLEILSVASVQ